MATGAWRRHFTGLSMALIERRGFRQPRRHVNLCGEMAIGEVAGVTNPYRFVDHMIRLGIMPLASALDDAGKPLAIGTNREAARYYGAVYNAAINLAKASTLRRGSAGGTRRTWPDVFRELHTRYRHVDDDIAVPELQAMAGKSHWR